MTDNAAPRAPGLEERVATLREISKGFAKIGVNGDARFMSETADELERLARRPADETQGRAICSCGSLTPNVLPHEVPDDPTRQHYPGLADLLTPAPQGEPVRPIDITRAIVEEAGVSLGPANKATRRICDLLAGAAPADRGGMRCPECIGRNVEYNFAANLLACWHCQKVFDVHFLAALTPEQGEPGATFADELARIGPWKGTEPKLDEQFRRTLDLSERLGHDVSHWRATDPTRQGERTDAPPAPGERELRKAVRLAMQDACSLYNRPDPQYPDDEAANAWEDAIIEAVTSLLSAAPVPREDAYGVSGLEVELPGQIARNRRAARRLTDLAAAPREQKVALDRSYVCHDCGEIGLGEIAHTDDCPNRTDAPPATYVPRFTPVEELEPPAPGETRLRCSGSCNHIWAARLNEANCCFCGAPGEVVAAPTSEAARLADRPEEYAASVERTDELSPGTVEEVAALEADLRAAARLLRGRSP